MTAPLYTIHIACHNNLALTRACINSVIDHSEDFELIVTDNASSDGTYEWLRQLSSGEWLHCKTGMPLPLRIVTNPTNQGYKDPCNHALTLARGEYLVLLNNDMTVCAGWLEAMRGEFADPKMGVVGLMGSFCHVGSDLRAHKAPDKADYVEGSCLMIPTALARKHSLFSDYLRFAYCEDLDLSLRLRELGYGLAWVDLPMKHERAGSTSRNVPEAKVALGENTQVMLQRWAFYLKRRDFRRRILVRRLGARGDVLLATPALWALRERYPQAELAIVTKCPEMLAGLDWLTMATRKRAYYDEFYDLDAYYEARPQMHIVEAFGEALGVAVPKRWQLFMAASEMDEVWAERVARGLRVALVHPGPTCWAGKNWPVDRWPELVGWLQERGYFVISVGAADGHECGADVALAGETTPQQLYALAKRASLFVGLDSMPQHVASAADTPSVVLFGPTNPRCIVRPTPRIVPVQVSTDVAPCAGEHGRRTKAITQAPCEGDCIKAISVTMVAKAVERVERLVA